jgi:hypothetical protein
VGGPSLCPLFTNLLEEVFSEVRVFHYPALSYPPHSQKEELTSGAR